MHRLSPVLTTCVARAAAYGVEHVPKNEGVVIVANHFSMIDAPLIAAFSPRPIHYLAKRELFENRFGAHLFGALGAFPRAAVGTCEVAALRQARLLVRTGRAVGIFVEGTRQRLPQTVPGRPGAAYVAIHEGVPVIPCGIHSFDWTPTSGVCAVVWGKPISLDRIPRTRDGYRAASELIDAELRRLWQAAAGAVAARLPRELPTGEPRTRGRARTGRWLRRETASCAGLDL